MSWQVLSHAVPKFHYKASPTETHFSPNQTRDPHQHHKCNHAHFGWWFSCVAYLLGFVRSVIVWLDTSSCVKYVIMFTSTSLIKRMMWDYVPNLLEKSCVKYYCESVSLSTAISLMKRMMWDYVLDFLGELTSECSRECTDGLKHDLRHLAQFVYACSAWNHLFPSRALYNCFRASP